MKQIKVLHLRSGTRLFGPERVILSLARGSSTRFQPIIAGLERGQESLLLQEARASGLPTLWLKPAGRLDRRSIAQLAQYIRQNDIALLHAHDFKANFYALAARRKAPCKLVTTLHLWNRSDLLTTAYEILDALLVRRFDQVIAVSPKIAAMARAWFIPEAKLRVILNGVDMARFASLEPRGAGDRFVIGTVGRLVEQKGYHFLLAAAAQIFSSHQNVSLLIVGDGPQKKSLQTEAKRLGIADRVLFAGQQDPIEPAYQKMDLFVSSSIDEGLPVALLEAMAARLPVVATRVGATADLIEDQKSGLLVPAKSAAALANAVLQLLDDREKLDRLAAAAYSRAANDFSADKMTRQYEAIYKGLIDNDWQ